MDLIFARASSSGEVVTFTQEGQPVAWPCAHVIAPAVARLSPSAPAMADLDRWLLTGGPRRSLRWWSASTRLRELLSHVGRRPSRLRGIDASDAITTDLHLRRALTPTATVRSSCASRTLIGNPHEGCRVGLPFGGEWVADPNTDAEEFGAPRGRRLSIIAEDTPVERSPGLLACCACRRWVPCGCARFRDCPCAHTLAQDGGRR